MAKMKNCKSCGAEIAKSAKVCPKCGAKQKKPTALIVLLVVVAIGLIASIGNSGSNAPTKVGEAETPSKTGGTTETAAPAETTAPADTAFHVGDIVELNDIKVTLVNVTENNGKNYMTPTDGNVFVICEFEIENNSSADIAVSSIMSFEAYIDDYSANMSLTATMSGDKSQLDGTVAAGKKMNGVIGYEAPKDWGSIEVRFTPNFWSGKDIIFEYSK